MHWEVEIVESQSVKEVADRGAMGGGVGLKAMASSIYMRTSARPSVTRFMIRWNVPGAPAAPMSIAQPLAEAPQSAEHCESN